MNESEAVHLHLDEDQIDQLARASLDGLSEQVPELDCEECEDRVETHGRCLSLARLLTRDTMIPVGTPAVEAVRTIRRQSYRRRALGEIATILMSAPQKVRV